MGILPRTPDLSSNVRGVARDTHTPSMSYLPLLGSAPSYSHRMLAIEMAVTNIFPFPTPTLHTRMPNEKRRGRNL